MVEVIIVEIGFPHGRGLPDLHCGGGGQHLATRGSHDKEKRENDEESRL